jgi:hypothetical protein
MLFLEQLNIAGSRQNTFYQNKIDECCIHLYETIGRLHHEAKAWTEARLASMWNISLNTCIRQKFGNVSYACDG